MQNKVQGPYSQKCLESRRTNNKETRDYIYSKNVLGINILLL